MTFNLNMEIIILVILSSVFWRLRGYQSVKKRTIYSDEFLYSSEKFVVTLTEWHTLRNTSFPISFRWVIRAKTLVYVRRLSFRLCFLYKVLLMYFHALKNSKATAPTITNTSTSSKCNIFTRRKSWLCKFWLMFSSSNVV